MACIGTLSLCLIDQAPEELSCGNDQAPEQSFGLIPFSTKILEFFPAPAPSCDLLRVAFPMGAAAADLVFRDASDDKAKRDAPPAAAGAEGLAAQRAAMRTKVESRRSLRTPRTFRSGITLLALWSDFATLALLAASQLDRNYEDVAIHLVVSTLANPLENAVFHGHLLASREHALTHLLGVLGRRAKPQVDDKRPVRFHEHFSFRGLPRSPFRRRAERTAQEAFSFHFSGYATIGF